MNIQYPNFLFSFAKVLKINLVEAQKIWSSFTINLHKCDKELIESGGAESGRKEAIYYSTYINLSKARNNKKMSCVN